MEFCSKNILAIPFHSFLAWLKPLFANELEGFSFCLFCSFHLSVRVVSERQADEILSCCFYVRIYDEDGKYANPHLKKFLSPKTWQQYRNLSSCFSGDFSALMLFILHSSRLVLIACQSSSDNFNKIFKLLKKTRLGVYRATQILRENFVENF